MKPAVDLHVRGGTIVPMVPGRPPFHGDLLIHDRHIAAVVHGSPGDIAARQVLDATDALVVPGFIQCHVHVAQSLLRHQADGLPLLDWLRTRTWPYEAALDGDATEAAAELGISELLAGGTTTALDFGVVHHQERVFQAAERLGIRMVAGKCHMDMGEEVPPALVEDRDRSLADAHNLGRRWHGASSGRIRYAVAPRFALSCTRGMLTGCAELARSAGWLLHSHSNETRDEVALIRRLTGLRPIHYLHEVGLTGEDVVLAHGVHLEPEEIQLLATTRTSVCHCPGANLKLASGIADVPRLRAAGVTVALGGDGPPCNNRLSMFQEMSLAATLHGLHNGAGALSALDVLAMATREGARALGLDHLTGTLEEGKAADVTVIGLEGWALQPGGEPPSRVVYGATAGDVRHVVVDGRAVVVDRRLQTAREETVREHAQSAWRATAARMREERRP